MASSIQLLLKTGPSAKPSSTAKPSFDETIDDFKTQLDRASDRKPKDSQDSPDADAPKKTEKPAAAKKPQSKTKHRKAADKEDESTEATDETAKTDDAKPADATQAAPEDAEETDIVVNGDKPVPVKAKSPEANADLAAQTAANQPATAPKTPDASANPAVTEQTAAVAAVAPKDITQPTATATTAEPEEDAEAASAEAGTDATKAAHLDPAVAALGEESPVAIAPKSANTKKADSDAVDTDAAATDAQTVEQYLNDLLPSADAKPHDDKAKDSLPDATTAVASTATKPFTPATAAPAKPQAAPVPPEARFAETNHAEIVKGIQTELLPRGGTMQIRLDPPELGALQVILTVKDGVMNATFQTSSDDATRMLSHSLSQLKTAMEAAGVSVDKLQVQHTPKDTQANTGDDSQRHQPGQDDMSRQQEQQRKEMIKRMWRKLSGENDPLDLVA